MNTDNFKYQHITKDHIKEGCVEIVGNSSEENKLCVIQEEFRNGIDAVKDIGHSVTFYGSARLKPDHPEYIKVNNLAYKIAKDLNHVIISGGGGGVMEAANKGAFDAGVKSIGLTIRLPHEQTTNSYVTAEVPFHFFFARQVSMSYTTEVCIFCAGGFGTLNELFEILTLMQTGKIDKIPVILYGSEFWNPIDKLIKELLIEKFHTIKDDDVNLYKITDNDDEILEIVKNGKVRNGDDSLTR